MYSKDFGKKGEQLAKEDLIRKGLKFIASNFTFKKLEIDLVFEDKTTKEIIFVEVKSRTSTDYGQPEEAIDVKKQINIRTAASVFIKLNSEFKNHKIRFDIYTVLKSGEEYIYKHTINGF
ncbi:MAG: YraN family protein [Candidatus Kapaibacterium sp.]